MVLGIPEYRLARDLIAARDRRHRRARHRRRALLPVGRDVTFQPWLDEHDAALPCGRHRPGRDLDLPGHELDGVLRAVEFLLNVNPAFRADVGEAVVVVGGGNVAFDAARTAPAPRPQDGVTDPRHPRNASHADDAAAG